MWVNESVAVSLLNSWSCSAGDFADEVSQASMLSWTQTARSLSASRVAVHRKLIVA